ncbi:hypothetical protein D3C75_479450 [compost metagenome]
MTQQPMYPAMNNSPGTELSAAVTAAATSIPVITAIVLPAAPNLITIGTDDTAEVILYTGISGNTLTGCTRGFGGTTARSWAIAARVARYYTAADHNAFKSNIEDLDARTGRVDLTQTIGPGLSVLTADANGSELDLVVNGVTRVNIHASYGNFEVDSNSDGLADGWAKGSGGTYSLETTGVAYGVKAQRINALAGDTDITSRHVTRSVNVEAGKTYVVIVNVVTDGTTQALMRTSAPGVNIDVNTTTNKVIFSKFTPSASGSCGTLLFNRAAVGSTGWVQYDGFGIYEVDAALYARIGVDITEANIRDYLPHVDGKQHVQGVAVTKKGRNLLPGFFDTLNANAKMNGPYDMKLTAPSTFAESVIYVPVAPNTTYTFSFSGTGRFYVGSSASKGGTVIGVKVGDQYAGAYTFTTESTATYLIVVATNSDSPAGTYTFKNWQLEVGASATPFTQAEPQSVILPITLGEVGGIRDSVYSQGTEWMYLERLKKNVLLSGSLVWTLGTNYTGYKYVSVQTSNFTGIFMDKIAANVSASPPLRVSKFSGDPVQHAVAFSTAGADKFNYGTDTAKLDITIASADSGWGDSYSPSAAEISAYFYGYRMNNGTFGTSYNGSGTKTWAVIGATSNTGAVTTVPTSQAPITASWQPYTLDYALANAAAPVALPNAEGSITLHPGGNQISVETGVIQREKVVPKLDSGNYYIVSTTNTAYWGASALKKLASKIISVYQGESLDSRWIINSAPNARLSPSEYDASKDYYVTYIALDRYALTANVTETAATWRTGLGGVVSDVVQSVAELRQADDRQDFAIDYAEAKTDNLRIDFTAHQVDYVRQPGYIPLTTGGPTAYAGTLTPAPTAIVEGFGVTVVFNVTNAANPTLNIDGLGVIALKDQKGVAYAAGKLIAGKPYMFRKVGADFLADSAGGSGNAVAGDIRAGKKAATDAGDVTGTLPVQTGGTVTPTTSVQTKAAGIYDTAITIAAVSAPANKILSDTTIAGVTGTVPIITSGSDPAQDVGLWPDGGLAVYPSPGYRGGGAGPGEIKVSSAQLQAAEADLRASNIRSGVNVFGVTGTLVEGKPFATGTYSSGPAWSSMTVTGLAFTPRVIIIRSSAGSFAKQYVYLPVAVGELNAIGMQWNPNQVVTSDGVNTANVSWSIFAGGFSVDFGAAQQINVTYTWECYGY